MCREIPLQNGKVALVSECDFERVSQYRWSCDNNGYACRMESFFVDGKRKRRKILLHRFVTGTPKGTDIDHRNRVRLDNRRENLRVATRSQNTANSSYVTGASRYKGVSHYKRNGKWRAEITVNRVRRHLGTFACEVDAARAYDMAALAAWGEFAYLNFPEHRYAYQVSNTIQRMAASGYRWRHSQPTPN